MPAMRTLLILSLVLFGCSDDKTNNNTPDAGAGSDAGSVTPPLALDCNTYCTHLATDCKDANAQLNPTNCMGTCMAFPPGTQADISGNTLGCRNYHLQNIEVRNMPAAMHCPHAGPIGSLAADATAVCGTSACDDFCQIQTKVCGTDATPVTGVTNRYTDLAACKAACTGFTKTPEASPTVQSGNTFACRVYHLTNAAAQTTTAGTNAHCGHTLVSVANPSNATTVGPCFQ
jgi:hypothetical protein